MQGVNQNNLNCEKNMTSKLVRIEAPIKGIFGENVNVGDEVMVMTTGWGNAYLRKGKYLGYVEGTGHYKQCAQVSIVLERRVQMKPDGTEFNWNKDYNMHTWDAVRATLTIKKVPYEYITTLKLNRIATLKS
jgi:hypothetical protein